MSNRDTYAVSVKAAAPVKTATLTTNQTTAQETINASGVNVGYTLQSGNYANLASAVKSANQAKRDADFTAEQTKQAALMVARDTLRDTGDRAPF
jgi:hypothetical protein